MFGMVLVLVLGIVVTGCTEKERLIELHNTALVDLEIEIVENNGKSIATLLANSTRTFTVKKAGVYNIYYSGNDIPKGSTSCTVKNGETVKVYIPNP
jgi:hypothetical protein